MKEIVLTRLCRRLKVSVLSFEQRFDIDANGSPGSEYTAYVVHIIDILDRNQWKLYKRYSDFSKLYSQVNNRFATVLIDYKFPNKSMFNTFSTFTKVRRREGFDDLMQRLLNINPAPEELSYFLELDEHIEESTWIQPPPSVTESTG